LPPLPAITPWELKERRDRGAIVLDTRPASDFAAAHIPGSIQIGLVGQYASWAGIVLGLDSEIILVAEDPEKAAESRLRLTRVGIERVSAYLDGGIAQWTRESEPVEQMAQVSAEQLRALLKDDPQAIQVLDVRRANEWHAGHVEQAQHKPLDHLTANLAGLDMAKPVAVYCKGGYRSSIAASLLQRAGFQNVLNVTGGFDAWLACKLPYVTDEAVVAG